MTIRAIIDILTQWAPLCYAEDFDNVGLLTGSANQSCKGVLITLDTLETVVDEAIASGCNLIVSFHPILFKGLKKISSWVHEVGLSYKCKYTGIKKDRTL